MNDSGIYISPDEIKEDQEKLKAAMQENTQGARGYFVVREAGVYYVNPSSKKDAAPIFNYVCGRLAVVARTRNADHKDHGYLLEWADCDGYIHQWAMPAELLKGDGADMRGELLNRGLNIAPTQRARLLLMQYIQECSTAERALSVDCTGWHGSVYVLPTKSFGIADERIIYQASTHIPHGYAVKGSLAEWRDGISSLCRGSSRLIFSISCAFAGALLKLAGEESGGFHYFGSSSSGKTTAQHLACSVWGGRDRKQSWRATTNALEAIAALHNDGFLALDEMAQANPYEIGDTAYTLGNGNGKLRASRTGAARKPKRWLIIWLSTGEIRLDQHMQTAGKKIRAGQELRMVDIPADAGSGYGCVESLNGFDSAKELMDCLNARSQSFYGSAGEAFLENLTKTHNLIPSSVNETRSLFLSKIVPNGASSQILRVASRFSLVAFAGELATEYGITGWHRGESLDAAITCFGAWLEQRGTVGDQEPEVIKRQVRAFFELHGASRFESCSGFDRDRIPNRAGFVRGSEKGDTFYVLPEAYRNEICEGFDMRVVSKVLIDAGWLEPDKEGKTSQRPTLPGMGRTRAYVFTQRMWEDEL